jgi:flagellar hook-length control protein FliK
LLGLEGTDLMPLLSVSAADGQNLPLDLSQAELPDGNGLPLSPELMWSGMLIVNGADGSGPQLYQLSEDGQTLTAQVDPNLRAQISRAMGRAGPLADGELPAMLNLTGQPSAGQTSQQLANQQLPGLHDQTLFFTATGTSPDANLGQKFTELLPAAMLVNHRDTSAAAPSGDASAQATQLTSLGLGLPGDADTGKSSGMVQLQMSGSPRHPGWSQGLGERVQWMVQQNVQGAEIRLDPPDLGKLEVKIQVNGEHGTTHIHFSSPNGAVREALEHAIPRLREMFADSGLSLGDVNVSQQSFAEQQQNSGAGGDNGGRAPGGMATTETALDEGNSVQKRLIAEGLVDMYV